MQSKILTTKNSNKVYLVSQIISDILYVALGIFCMQRVESLRDHWQFKAAESMSTFATLLFIFAFISIIYHLMVASTIAEMRNNKITGKGLQAITLKSFDLRFDQISGISTSKGILNLETGKCVYLIVNTTSGNYKVIASPEQAEEMIAYFNNLKV